MNTPRVKHAPALDDEYAHPFKGLTLCNFAVRFGGFARDVNEVTCKLCLKILRSKRYAEYLRKRPRLIAELPQAQQDAYHHFVPWELV